MSTPGASHGFELEGSATCPVIRGQHLVVACGHYLATLAGMRMRDSGGNVVDAGVAMAFAQAVVEFQSYGLGGECPILIHSAVRGEVVGIDGNTRAPAAATSEWFRRRGIALVPKRWVPPRRPMRRTGRVDYTVLVLKSAFGKEEFVQCS